MSLTSIAILIAIVISLALMMTPRVAGSMAWHATVTPLASIIGSGFLVLGPILNVSYGRYATWVMIGLCLCAYAFGAVIRFNMRVIASGVMRSPAEERLERIGSWALAVAYIVSVAYYVNLFGAFGVSVTPVADEFHARALASAVLCLLLWVGWTRGFSALEHLEQLTVSLKLAIIAGLLVGLGLYFKNLTANGALTVKAPQLSGWAALTLAFGLIITVQGFEISRYLGERFDAELRIRSMRWAQGLAAFVYILYTFLFSFSFDPNRFELNETAIIEMMVVVAPILPAMLVGAALSAQFSAAIADTAGSGGLVTEMTAGRLSERAVYAVVVFTALLLTWRANIFEIINLASRGFALYYCVQSSIAFCALWRLRREPTHRQSQINTITPLRMGFGLIATAAMALLGALILIFGTSAEATH